MENRVTHWMSLPFDFGPCAGLPTVACGRGSAPAGGAAGGVRSVLQHLVAGRQADGRRHRPLDRQAAPADGARADRRQGVSRDGRAAGRGAGDGADRA